MVRYAEKDRYGIGQQAALYDLQAKYAEVILSVVFPRERAVTLVRSTTALRP